MGSFDGVAEIYEKSRPGYPPELRDRLVKIEVLNPDSAVVDLGAGTGQLAMMAADIASNVVAIDPEKDMVRVGRRTTSDRSGIRWMVGTDHEILALLVPPIDLVLIGNAFHHMDRANLVTSLDSLVSPGGAVVVCSSSVPVWHQDSEWSAALRAQLEEELGRPVGEDGIPDHESDLAVLTVSRFSDVENWVFERAIERTAESIIGEVVSSASGAIDSDAAVQLRSVLDPYLSNGTVSENLKTTALIARRPSA